MAMLQVGGVNVTPPKTFQVTIMDLDSDKSTRNANGDMTRDRIAVKRQIEASWGALTNAQISSLLGGMTATFFTINYPDPLVGGNTTKTFYVSDRTAPYYDFGRGLWEGVSMTFIEK